MKGGTIGQMLSKDLKKALRNRAMDSEVKKYTEKARDARRRRRQSV
jgi:chemotaxis regulatin CheY-phosphate phosphatase CheZ